MKKAIFFLLVFVNIVYGFNYDDVSLKAQASIFPKILLLDKKLDEKLVDGKIVYTIVYDKNDYNTAVKISELIKSKHMKHLDKYAYKINIVEFSDLSSDTQATAIYALNSDDKIQKVAKIANEKGIATFSYDIKNLRHGLLFSLMIEKSITLYLNRANLLKSKVDFVDSLLQMVKFIDTK